MAVLNCARALQFGVSHNSRENDMAQQKSKDGHAQQLNLWGQNGPEGQPEAQIFNHIVSTPDEIKRAVERNAIDRGVLFIGIIVELEIDDLLNLVEDLGKTTDKEEIAESADALGIDLKALTLLDNVDPPIPYPYYFCTSNFLVQHPELAFYYRNIAMLSAKVMRGIGLDTIEYEAGNAPTKETATEIAKYLNPIISGLILDTGVTRNRHIEMLMANLGDSLGGSSRNEVGRVAMAQVMRPLIKLLCQHDRLESITYSTRSSLVPGTPRDPDETLIIGPQTDIGAKLNEIERDHVKYMELRLRNGVLLLVDKIIRWYDNKGKEYTPSADLHSARESTGAETDMIWGAEVKGGADPAGSDEHWKTASRALTRILENASKSGRAAPPLSFIGTTIVNKVAVEIVAWIDRGDLVSAYNLTKIIEQPAELKRFLADMMEFLGYNDPQQSEEQQADGE
jgi:hypothetical protein